MVTSLGVPLPMVTGARVWRVSAIRPAPLGLGISFWSLVVGATSWVRETDWATLRLGVSVASSGSFNSPFGRAPVPVFKTCASAAKPRPSLMGLPRMQRSLFQSALAWPRRRLANTRGSPLIGPASLRSVVGGGAETCTFAVTAIWPPVLGTFFPRPTSRPEPRAKLRSPGNLGSVPGSVGCTTCPISLVIVPFCRGDAPMPSLGGEGGGSAVLPALSVLVPCDATLAPENASSTLATWGPTNAAWRASVWTAVPVLYPWKSAGPGNWTGGPTIWATPARGKAAA